MALWVFPGQGTQRRGMGAGVLERHQELCERIDELLGYSIRELCLEDPDNLLSHTSHAQPAIFVVNALSYLERDPAQPPADWLAGHSLGELNALHAAGCFDLDTGIRLVRRRGELMEAAAGGAMAAVVGPSAQRTARSLVDSFPEVDLANDNSAEQVVLSGPGEAIAAIRESLRGSRDVRCVPLHTNVAFHSRYMAQAAAEFGRYLATLKFADPVIAVIANATARTYPPGSVADLLARQIASPVRWRESMAFAVEQGVTELQEVGAVRILTPMWPGAAAGGALARAAPADPARAASAPQEALESISSRAQPHAELSPAERLGSAEFRSDYAVRYAYLQGSMFRGVASADMVVRMARAGLMGFFGAGGLDLPTVERAIASIRERLGPNARFGVNLLHEMDDPAAERASVDMLLRNDVRYVEAAAFASVTPALVRFRFSGAHTDPAGRPVAIRHVVAKVSRLAVATAFMRPPTERMLAQLVACGALTAQEAQVARHLPVSGDVCVESDSGGHTDGGVALVLLPVIRAERDAVCAGYAYPAPVRVGAAGGLGTPEAVAAAFVLGADFVVTGSVNQCSPEAGTSQAVKELLSRLDIHDTAYAPAGDMFELGAQVQVVRRGSLFAARASTLLRLYRQHASLEDLDEDTRQTLETTYFGAAIDEVWRQTAEYYRGSGRSDVVEKAERDPRQRMAMVFRWYFAKTMREAAEGTPGEQANYQIHCGPALGAFNRIVRGTALEPVAARHVDAIAELLMTGAARVLASLAQG